MQLGVCVGVSLQLSEPPYSRKCKPSAGTRVSHTLPVITLLANEGTEAQEAIPSQTLLPMLWGARVSHILQVSVLTAYVR